MTNNRNRVTKGVSTGGQFATEQRTEDSSISLGASPAVAHHIDQYLDHAVGAIMDGPLSRGVVNSAKRDRFVADRYEALSQGRTSFVAGMDDTARALYVGKTPANVASWLVDLATSGKKRVGGA